MSLTRRAFLVQLGLYAAAGHSRALRVGVVGLDRSPLDACLMGITLGIDEAKHAAALFGTTVEAVSVSPNERPSGVAALIGDADDSRCAALADRSAKDGFVFVNVACASDALRRCSRTTFHVAPSDAMCRDAAAAAGSSPAVVSAWHPSLSRFGADTLNQRFLNRFGRAMDGVAWCAWFGVKVVWETSLRTRSVDADAIGAALVRDTIQFDGHKGRPLSFRAWDRQLRQPLYVAASDGLIEVPAQAGAQISAKELLDRIGASAAPVPCT